MTSRRWPRENELNSIFADLLSHNVVVGLSKINLIGFYFVLFTYFAILILPYISFVYISWLPI